MILALNLDSALKQLVLGAAWIGRRMKATRFLLIEVPARLVSRARQLVLRISGEHPALALLVDVRRAILALAPGPAS